MGPNRCCIGRKINFVQVKLQMFPFPLYYFDYQSRIVTIVTKVQKNNNWCSFLLWLETGDFQMTYNYQDNLAMLTLLFKIHLYCNTDDILYYYPIFFPFTPNVSVDAYDIYTLICCKILSLQNKKIPKKLQKVKNNIPNKVINTFTDFIKNITFDSNWLDFLDM